MARCLWTPLAELELEEILLYIGLSHSRPETARRIGEELRAIAEQQATNPLAGHKHAAAPEGWLYFNHKRWLAFYQPLPDGIEVMRVVDAVRDLPELLGE